MQPITSEEQLKEYSRQVYVLESRDGLDSVKLQELELLRTAIRLYQENKKTKPFPCPFCGNEEMANDRHPRSGIYIYCPNCKASGPYATSQEEAIIIWNNRYK